MPEEKPKTIKLDKEQKKEILSALSDLRAAVKEEKEHPKTVADKMAARLAEDPKQGIFSALAGSLKERGSERAADFKKALDPVNIVKRLTGGSKLASVLTGKALGRSPEEIRQLAGLPAPEKQEETSSPEQLSLFPEKASGPTEFAPSGFGGLETLTRILSSIALRVDQIAGAMGAKPKFEKASQRYKVKGRFVATAPAQAAEAGMAEAQNYLLGAEKSADKNPIQVIADSTQKTAELADQLVQTDAAQLKLFEKEEQSRDVASGQAEEDKMEAQRKLAALARGGTSTSPERVAGVGGQESGESGGLISNILGAAAAYKTAKGAVKGGWSVAKKLGGKFLGKLGMGAAAGATAAQVLEKGSEGTAKVIGTETAKGAAKADATTATKSAIKKKIASAIAKRIPKAMLKAVGKSIPVIGGALGIGLAIDRLVRGDFVGAGLEAVSGLGSAATAIPATAALVAKDVYQDVYGIPPEEDPMAPQRMTEIQDATLQAATEFVEGKADTEKPEAAPETEDIPEGLEPTPSSPELVQEPNVEDWAQDVAQRQEALGMRTIEPGDFEPISSRTQGRTLDEISKDTERSKEFGLGSSGGGSTVNNNTVVKTSKPTTVVMPGVPVRSTDLSFQRASGFI